MTLRTHPDSLICFLLSVGVSCKSRTMAFFMIVLLLAQIYRIIVHISVRLLWKVFSIVLPEKYIITLMYFTVYLLLFTSLIAESEVAFEWLTSCPICKWFCFSRLFNYYHTNICINNLFIPVLLLDYTLIFSVRTLLLAVNHHR
jgi:hypothetical protein